MNDRGALTLVPFLAIAATFEISFFIHMGVERVGRYLQVLYEPPLHPLRYPTNWLTTSKN